MNALRRALSFGTYWAARLTGPVVGVFTGLLHAVICWTGGGPQTIDPFPPDVKIAADTPPVGHKRWRRRRRFR